VFLLAAQGRANERAVRAQGPGFRSSRALVVFPLLPLYRPDESSRRATECRVVAFGEFSLPVIRKRAPVPNLHEATKSGCRFCVSGSRPRLFEALARRAPSSCFQLRRENSGVIQCSFAERSVASARGTTEFASSSVKRNMEGLLVFRSVAFRYYAQHRAHPVRVLRSSEPFSF